MAINGSLGGSGVLGGKGGVHWTLLSLPRIHCLVLWESAETRGNGVTARLPLGRSWRVYELLGPAMGTGSAAGSGVLPRGQREVFKRPLAESVPGKRNSRRKGSALRVLATPPLIASPRHVTSQGMGNLTEPQLILLREAQGGCEEGGQGEGQLYRGVLLSGAARRTRSEG